jgi:hypothetical protein
MMHCKNKTDHTANRLGNLHNLLFFVILSLFSCKQADDSISVIWDNHKAKAVSIPAEMMAGFSAADIRTQVKITKANDTTAILGDFRLDNGWIFEPLIPFQRGASYAISIADKSRIPFHIPADDSHTAARVIAVYPELDTLPENLLKFYIRFSQPMREGESMQHIRLIKNNTDTLPGVFLDLQPELWNENRTVLTIWLDPGRIKRDLQPNLRMGAPLAAREKYQLLISRQWQDAEGFQMQSGFSKSFITVLRDSLSPDPLTWKMILPKASSIEPLQIQLGKALDHFLLLESLQITDKKGSVVTGTFETTDKDRICYFIPEQPWVTGTYNLIILSKLEDLSGNNLNRPFDRDITKTKEPSTQPSYTRPFTIGK